MTVKKHSEPRHRAPDRGDEYQAMLDRDPRLTRAKIARNLGISRAAVTQALGRRRINQPSESDTASTILRMSESWPTIGSPFAEQAEDWILERTVPLYAQTRTGDPVPWGSAVLLRVGEASFLVTAAHVVAELIGDGRRLLVATGPHEPLVGLDGLEVAMSTDKTHVDVAFLQLPTSLVAKIGAHKKFLGLDRVDTARAPAVPGWYMIVGFPVQHSSKDQANRTVNSGALCMHTVLREDAVDLALGTSIGLAFERYGTGADGEALPSPALLGISGCGIWCVAVSKDEVARGTWTTDSIFLAGIEHRLLGHTTIKGTLAFHVESAIRHRYPELLRSILATGGPLIPGRQSIFFRKEP